MSDRPEKAEKARRSVTLTRPYLDALDRLVRDGIYIDQGSAIRGALRLYFEIRGIPPFWVPERPPEEGGEGDEGSDGDVA